MCGFIGRTHWRHDKSFRPSIIEALDVLTIRGPDDHGYTSGSWYEAGHTRLSILDLSWRGHQPISDSTGRYLMVYNGEIYNFREINEYLRKQGVQLRSESDSETLVELFAHKGFEAFGELQGMFSGAIFDLEEMSVCIFRDRIGVKPIYYTFVDGDIYFASTPPALKKAIGRSDIDSDQIFSYLAFRSSRIDNAFYRDMHSLQPGTVLKIFPDGTKEKFTFWDIRDFMGRFTVRDAAEAQEGIRFTLEQAVKKRLVADVPVGAFLSGGLDSTIVLHYMAGLSQEKINAHTFTSIDPTTDETERACRTANLYGANCHVVEVDYSNYLRDITYLTHLKGAPLTVQNEYAIYQMARQMKETNTVVLSGEGADEIFLGYSRIFSSAARSSGDIRNKDQMSSWIFEKYRYVSPKTLKLCGFTNKFVDDYIDSGVAYVRSILEELNGGSLVDNLQYFFLRHHLPTLLARLDNSTMAASIEGRAPFTDHQVVEFALSIPHHLKIGRGEDSLFGKKVLYNSFLDLPSWVTQREKIGFSLGDTLANQSHQMSKSLLHTRIDPRFLLQGSDVTPVEKWHISALASFAESEGLTLL